jgi:putative peptidoglycan lipid II flippase
VSRLPGRSGSNLVAAGIFLSRIAGVVREVVLGLVFGLTPVADAFRFAMRVPNFLQNLLGEGALSASFIPVYARLVEDGEDGEADELAGAVAALLAATTAVLVAAGVLLAEPLVIVFSGFEGGSAVYELAVSLTRITTTGLGFLVLSAWCLGILNSHRSFFLPYVAPVVWNGVQIVALGAALVAGWAPDRAAIVLAWAVVIGGMAQFAIQVPRVMKLAPALRFSFHRTPEVNDVLGRFAPAVGARGVVQVSSLADTLLATALVTGALAAFSLTLPLYLLPISLFGFSVAAAELAEMSRRSSALEAVSARVVPALRRVLVPAGLVTVAFIVGGRVMIDALYGWPARLLDRDFSDADVTLVWLILAGFAIGLPATMTARITQNTLYSLGDVRGPARIAVIRLVVVVASSLVLMLQFDWLFLDSGTRIVEFGDFPHWPAWERVPELRRVAPEEGPTPPPHLGAVGLGLGSSIGSWVEWVLLRRRLARQLGRPVRSGWFTTVALASILSGLAMLIAVLLPLPSPLDAVLVGGTGVTTYLAGLWMQGVRSMAQLASSP